MDLPPGTAFAAAPTHLADGHDGHAALADYGSAMLSGARLPLDYDVDLYGRGAWLALEDGRAVIPVVPQNLARIAAMAKFLRANGATILRIVVDAEAIRDKLGTEAVHFPAASGWTTEDFQALVKEAGGPDAFNAVAGKLITVCEIGFAVVVRLKSGLVVILASHDFVACHYDGVDKTDIDQIHADAGAPNCFSKGLVTKYIVDRAGVRKEVGTKAIHELTEDTIWLLEALVADTESRLSTMHAFDERTDEESAEALEAEVKKQFQRHYGAAIDPAVVSRLCRPKNHHPFYKKNGLAIHETRQRYFGHQVKICSSELLTDKAGPLSKLVDKASHAAREAAVASAGTACPKTSTGKVTSVGGIHEAVRRALAPTVVTNAEALLFGTLRGVSHLRESLASGDALGQLAISAGLWLDPYWPTGNPPWWAQQEHYAIVDTVVEASAELLLAMLIPASQEELQREMVDNAMRTWRKKLNAADAFDAALEAHVSRGEGDEFAATVPQLRALLMRRTRSKMATSGFDSLDSDEKERMANIIAGNDLKVGKLQRGATVDDKVAALAACCAEANSGDGPRRAPLNRIMKDRGVLHFYTQHISGTSSNFGRWRAISKDVKLAMETLGPSAFGTRFADVPPSELATELKRCADTPAVRFSNLALAFKTNGGDPPTHHSEMYQFWRNLRTGGGLSTAGRQEELTRANLTPHDFGFECEGDTEGQVLRLLQAQVQAANSKAVVCKTRKRKADSSIADGTPSGSSAVGEGAIKPKKKRRTKESPAVDVAQLHQEGKFETITADQIRRWLQKVKGVKAFTLTADTEVTARAGGVKTVTVHASAEPYKIDGWTRSHVLKAVALTIILK